MNARPFSQEIGSKTNSIHFARGTVVIFCLLILGLFSPAVLRLFESNVAKCWVGNAAMQKILMTSSSYPGYQIHLNSRAETEDRSGEAVF